MVTPGVRTRVITTTSQLVPEDQVASPCTGCMFYSEYNQYCTEPTTQDCCGIIWVLKSDVIDGKER